MSMKQKDHYKTGIKNVQLMKYTPIPFLKLEAQWAETCVTRLKFCFEETWYRTFHRYLPPSCGSFI